MKHAGDWEQRTLKILTRQISMQRNAPLLAGWEVHLQVQSLEALIWRPLASSFTRLFCFVARVNAHFTEVCDCPIGCFVDEFDVSLSYAQYPSNSYGQTLGDEGELNITLPEKAYPPYSSKLSYIK